MLDMLLRDVRVHTVDDARPTASAIGVLGGRVVGLDEEVVDLPARTVVEGQGAVVVPGFGDAHNHMAWFGQSLGEIDLSVTSSLAGVEDAVAGTPSASPRTRGSSAPATTTRSWAPTPTAPCWTGPAVAARCG